MTGFGDHPNGQGFEVNPWLQRLEDAEAELAERFARDDRLADYTAPIGAGGTNEGDQGNQTVFRGAAERPQGNDGRVQGVVVGGAPRAGRVGVRGARGDVRADERHLKETTA